jgi:hypothetical protein
MTRGCTRTRTGPASSGLGPAAPGLQPPSKGALKVVSAPTFSALTSMCPTWLTLPPRTRSPVPTSDGKGSTGEGEVSTDPGQTAPPRRPGTLSPGSTTTTFARLDFFSAMTSRVDPRFTRAVRGARFNETALRRPGTGKREAFQITSENVQERDSGSFPYLAYQDGARRRRW